MKIKKVLFIGILIFLLSPILVKASELELVDTIYPYDYVFEDVIEGYDENGNVDGYVIVGKVSWDNGYIEKRDFSGNQIWMFKYSDGYEGKIDNVVLSYNNLGKVDGYIVDRLDSIDKFDLNGNKLWGCILDIHDGNFSPQSTTLTYSYNYLGQIDGVITSYNVYGAYNKWFMSKVDLNGNLVWTKEIKSVENLILGYNSLGKVDGYITNYLKGLIKYDLDGNFVWEKENTYSGDLKTEAYGNSGKVDGYILISGDDNLIKYDLEGNLVWTKKQEESLNDRIGSFALSYSDSGKIDGYIMAGFDDFHPDIKKLDLEGNIIWKKLYDTEGSELSILGLYPLYNNEKKIDDYIIIGEGYLNWSLNLYSYPKANIKVEDNSNGILQVINKSRVGAMVTVQVNPNTGYIFDKLIVTDETGKEIEVNGTSFIMPKGDVLIKTLYRKAIDISDIINPPTNAFWYIVLFIVFICLLATNIVNKRSQLIKNDNK